MIVKLDHLPRDRGESNEYLKPPPRKYHTIWIHLELNKNSPPVTPVPLETHHLDTPSHRSTFFLRLRSWPASSDTSSKNAEKRRKHASTMKMGPGKAVKQLVLSTCSRVIFSHIVVIIPVSGLICPTSYTPVISRGP